MQEEKAVCLMSGGLDSSVTAIKAREKGFDIYGLTIIYQENKEYEMLQAFTEKFDIPLTTLRLNLDPIKFATPEEAASEYEDTSATYSPFRNPILLSLAVSYAMTIEASKIFVGFEHEPNYPDTTPSFVNSFNTMIKNGTPEEVAIEVVAPFVHNTKVEVIKEAKRLNIPMELTWSCYNSGKKPCLECNGCKERIAAFKKAGIRDPLIPPNKWQKMK